MKNSTSIDKCVSRHVSSSSMQRSTQRNLSGIVNGTTSTNVASIQNQSSFCLTPANTAATGLVVQPHKHGLKSTPQKRRIKFKYGKASAIVVDPRDVIRISILVLASLCCLILCQSLVQMLNDEAAIQKSGESFDSNQMKLNISFQGKEQILRILKEAGITDLNQNTIDRLPTWEEITSLYGPQPVIYGLDTCSSFRESSDPADHFLSVAGTFNSGTNLLAELLIHNCHLPARMAKFGPINEGIRWQVPWGKHTPINDEEVRQTHKISSADKIPANNVFPAVTIRDPAVWAVSMCRNEYAMDWTHTNTDEIRETSQQHCPNFVPNEIDYKQNVSLRNESSIPVVIHYAEFDRGHDSMIDHWNDFYYEYYKQALFPRLIVRFEDLIFHPKSVVRIVCECAGGVLKQEQGFQYIVDSAKKMEGHGSAKTGYVDAIVKYGSVNFPRWQSGGMTDDDRNYAREHLDHEMMNFFGYHYPDRDEGISVD